MDTILNMYHDNENTTTYEDATFITYISPELYMKFNKVNYMFSVKCNKVNYGEDTERYKLETIEDFLIFSMELAGDIAVYNLKLGVLEMEFLKYIAMKCYCENSDYKIN